MAKSKEQKSQMINDLSRNFLEKKSAVLINYQGLKVSEIQAMRRRLRDQKINFTVLKNSLLRIVLDKEKMEINPDFLEKPLAISFADDEVVLAKELVSSAKEYEVIEILGGYIEKDFVNDNTIKELSLLPGRDELYAKFVGSMNAPISGLVSVMAGNIRNLINLINNYRESIG